MKQLFTGLLLLLAIATYGQGLDSIALSKMKLNFIVPDMPAFKSLGTEPSNLLRPSTPMPLAVAISEFYKGDKFIIPRAFALEVTPAQLLNAKRNMADPNSRYVKNKVWNSFRVSLGSARDSAFAAGGRKLALGFRINVINNGEMATDPEALKAIVAKLAEFRVATRGLRRAFATKYLETVRSWALQANPSDSVRILKASQLDDITDWDFMLDTKLKSDASVQQSYNTFAAAYQQPEFDTWFSAFKTAYKKQNWNATKLDIALAIMGAAKDSMVGNIKFAQVAFWGTYALKTGDNGQTLIGLNAGIGKDTISLTNDNNYFRLSVPVRYLIGTNRVKGFCELQYQYLGQYKTHNGLLNFGAELNPLDGVWLNFYGGVNYNTTAGNTTFVTSLNIKVTLPEKFSFF